MQSAVPAPSEIGTPRFIRRKSHNPVRFYLLRFSLLFAAVFCLTLILCNFFLLSPEDAVSSAISSYLKNPFAACVYWHDYLTCVFDVCTPDMVQLALLLLLGMTFFCTPACALVVFYRAFSLGLCTSFLSSYLLLSEAGANDIAMAWIFVGAYIAVSFVLCAFSAMTCAVSLDIRAVFSGARGFGRAVVRRSLRLIGGQIVRFLTAGGAVILLRAIQTALFSAIAG